MFAVVARARQCALRPLSTLRCYTSTSEYGVAKNSAELPRYPGQPRQPTQAEAGKATRRPDKWGGALNDFLHKGTMESQSTAEQRWTRASEEATQALLSKPVITPYSGRSVGVIGGNVANAIRQMEVILSRNRVKQELRLAERHEKKGYKRRRLASERWRRLFAHEVRKKVMLVNEIRHRERVR